MQLFRAAGGIARLAREYMDPALAELMRPNDEIGFNFATAFEI
jgi:hypothetical protein